VQTVHVPYQGSARAVTDLINGTNTYQFITAVTVVDLIKSGRLRALVAMSHKRVAALADVPTVAEAGYSKLASEDWAGILVKSGAPASVVAQLNAAINKALKTEKVRGALANVGTDVGGGTPEQFGKLVSAEVAHWTKIIKDAGIKINP
jgi:tripartite-type tricarboxylate transporter receptor subunit TctC